MGAVHVDGIAILSSIAAIVDTGSRYIIGDFDSVAAFYKRIPGAVYIANGFYTGTSMMSATKSLRCSRYIVKCLAITFPR